MLHTKKKIVPTSRSGLYHHFERVSFGLGKIKIKFFFVCCRSRSKQCNICFKMYADSKSLKKHKEEVHSRLRPFVCNICGHASARKSMLALHQRQHTGQKPYECCLCSFRTADHNSLRKHIMRHTGNYLFTQRKFSPIQFINDRNFFPPRCEAL